MKILHVLNTAGVASTIAQYMDRNHETQSKVITRECQDRYGHTTYGEYWNHSFYVFLAKIIHEAQNHDIIHLHDRDILIPILKRIYPNKTVIIHYHGSKIRHQWSLREKYWGKADLIIAVTPELLQDAPPDVQVIENPVDTELFKSPNSEPEYSALHMEYGVTDMAKEIAENNSLPLTVHDRRKNPIPFLKMPELLSQHSHYIDLKYDKTQTLLHPPDAYSKTGLEALSCGLKILSVNQYEAQGLPEKHYPEKVAETIHDLYQKFI